MKGFTHESTHNESKEWYTPRWIFDGLRLQFDMDPCSPGADVVPWIPARKHLTIREDGLTSPWDGCVFMNPPYGMDTPRWFERLARHGNGIGLVFSRTDTQWFHDWMPYCDAVLFVKGRIGFVPGGRDYAERYAKRLYDAKSGCGAASMLVAFGATAMGALIESELGLVMFPAKQGNPFNSPAPVSRHSETFRDGQRFAGDKADAQQPTAVPHENPPGIAEPGAGGLFEQEPT